MAKFPTSPRGILMLGLSVLAALVVIRLLSRAFPQVSQVSGLPPI